MSSLQSADAHPETAAAQLQQLFAGVQRALFLHAHPDDETLATGALIVQLRRLGISCAVLTATRGEAGEVVPGPLAQLAGTEQLHAHRMDELARALRVLDVQEHVFLGTAPARIPGADPRVYRDSGMEWVAPGVAGPAQNAAADAFSLADIEDAVADTAALVRVLKPDVFITYNAHGGYGHPDHVRMHEVAKIVSDQYKILMFHVEHVEEAAQWWFTLPDTLPVVAEALRQHASQLTVQADGKHIVHSGGQHEAIVTAVGLSRG